MNLPIHRLALAAVTLSMMALTGCTLGSNSAPATPIASSLGTIHGRAYGGQAPIVGASVYVYAAGTSAYGGASQLLSSTVPMTDSNGAFTVTSDYNCTSGQQVYIYVLGGNTGGGANNSSGLMAILGQCPASGSLASVTPNVWVNEVSTVAAAYAIAGFATDATDISDDEAEAGNTTGPLAATGMATAFANAANLENIATGTAYATTPTAGSNGTVPQAQINTVADILAACVNTATTTGTTPGPSATCQMLFSNALSASGTTPTDTATAAINIAKDPTANVGTLYGLIGTQPAFAPDDAAAPANFTISILYPQGGTGTTGIAIDSNDNMFFSYGGGNLVYKITPTGIMSDISVSAPRHLAVDQDNNIWVPSYSTSATSYNTITELNDSLSAATPYASYDGTKAITGLESATIDANGDVWADGYKGTAIELNSSGVFLNEISGTPMGAFDLAINPSGIIAITGGETSATAMSNTLSLYTSAGVAIGTEPTASGGGLDDPEGVISDTNGNFWVANNASNITSEFTSAGLAVSNTGYTTSGTTLIGADFDGLGNYYTGGDTTAGIYVLNSSGTQTAVLTPPVGGNQYFGVDGAGDLWYGGKAEVGEMIGVAAPKVTPIVTATFDGHLAKRP